MTRPPFRTAPTPPVKPQRTDEEIATDAMKDIYANVTDARGNWRDYDLRYVTQRILRAIKDAKA